VPSRLLAGGGAVDPTPAATIAIPTFKRPEFLAEAVASALAQRFDRPFEIVIVDNDPGSRGAAALLDRLPELAQARFRYFVNAENIGMFGNWNRCIELARAPWVTILNDDDLLDPDYLTTMFATIDRRPDVDGIASRKRGFDQRQDKAPEPGLARSLAKRGALELSFRGQASRRIRARQFFWGAILGNGGGFIFRKRAAEAIGGYYAEEFPSADVWFAARFAAIFHLRQHRAVAASIRTAENESMKEATARASLQCMVDLQNKLLGGAAPRWWRRFVPLTVARDLGDYRRNLKVELDRGEMEGALGMKIPPERPYRLWASRLFLGGI
jgi:glycosyltransferase involved in cell wall biosynthesis